MIFVRCSRALGIISLFAWVWGCAIATLGQDLPVKPQSDRQLIVLQAESDKGPAVEGMQSFGGEVIAKTNVDYVTVEKDRIIVGKSGFANWSVRFRHRLDSKAPAGEYGFYARWMQGGDPGVCQQTYSVFAAPAGGKLEPRGVYRMTNSQPWQLAWIGGDQPLMLKGDEAVIEILAEGNGDSAKVYDAFVLGPLQRGKAAGGIELPASGVPERPVIALGFGPSPLGGVTGDASRLVYEGRIAGHESADYATINPGGEAVVAHKGLGVWGASFQFDLKRPIPPGQYLFHARYMCGGEPSQARQTFVVKAGASASVMGIRGRFETTNSTPFEFQWLRGSDGAITILPGDKVLQIVNTGQSHDAKVFSGFVLEMAKPLASWIDAAAAQRRSAFLSMASKKPNEGMSLYVLDGPGPDATLYAGLGDRRLEGWYGQANVEYLLEADAEAFGRMLNITQRPAAVLVNGDRRVLGVMADPENADQVVEFVRNGGAGGAIPPFAPRPVEGQALKEGAPVEWLVASGWPGQCGVGLWGLDAEALQRPNPGDPYAYGYYTAGHRFGRWEARPTQAGGICSITEKLNDSYNWGKGTSYALTYLKVDEARELVLHLQHSGVASAVYLDGVEQAMAEDESPAAISLPRQEQSQGRQVVQRQGQEVHNDVFVPQSAEASKAAQLSLTPGWHCLIVKLVHAQGKDERVLFGIRLTDREGKAVEGIVAQSRDPESAEGMAEAAAGLWPILRLEGVAANLPHPGEELTLRAEMRIPETSFISRWLPRAILPMDATLRVRMLDYDGNEVTAFETRGVFPGVVTLDLGEAPEPGYYALVPELYSSDGKLIRRYHPDGFSVVRGSVEQRQRADAKEVMNSWYYALTDWETFAPWLERTGLYKNVGSYPGVPDDALGKWEDARKRGIILFGDFAGDSTWMNNSEKDAEAVITQLPRYTRYFKSINEVDGRGEADWAAARDPKQYVERTKATYTALRQARSDAFFTAGSMYCAGVDRAFSHGPSPRQWFRECLELGLDKYVDAWDVHAYPKTPPLLEADSISNSPDESDLGVLKVYRELGRTNDKPFFLGETSALAWHGLEGMRWQAEMVAKMAAWTNSRADWLGIAMCAAHHDRRITAEDYAMARNPGEAALYTASALIDGLPYRRLATDDPQIQAAWFGPTLMVWRADGKRSVFGVPVDFQQSWVVVDVVGRVRPLKADSEEARLEISSSPIYILPESDYQRLTRMQ